MSEIILRQAMLSDAKNIATLHINSWLKAYQQILPASVLDNLSVAERQKQWLTWLSSPTSITYVIELEQKIIGFISFGPSRNQINKGNAIAEIYAIYVDPYHWHQNIGSKLLSKAFAEIKSNNYQGVILWVLKENLQAIKFYEKYGFRPTNKFKKFLDFQNVEEIQYEKEFTN